ncbi:MAG: VWA domain-containing protein [Planctomycetota bacterium]
MFYSPIFLWLLIPVAWLGWRMFRGQNLRSISFSTTTFASQLKPTLRQRLLWLPRVLILTGMVLLVLGLARPRLGLTRAVTETEGIAIEMVIDRSGSMQALDFQIGEQNVNRLTAVKHVAGKFISGEGELQGRVSDLIGLVTFAAYADGITPPTLDHAFLKSNLNNTEFALSRNEQGTSIGDAIALAVEKLNALDEKRDEKVKSKIMILLTDGENTTGELDPVAAAELAQTLGIKIYTIGVGTNSGQAPIPVQDAFTGRTRIQMMPVSIDEETLTQIANLTGGKYYRATDTDSLTRIYAEIDQLEKTEVESENFFDYRELAVEPYRERWLHIPPVLPLAWICLVIGCLLENTWLREAR